jgi:hypothetical protein
VSIAVINPGTGGAAATPDTLNVQGSVVVTPFSGNFLVQGIGPVGKFTVNGFPVANNTPCMVEKPGNLTNLISAGTTYQNNTGFPVFISAYLVGTLNAAVTVVADSSAVPSTVVFSQAASLQTGFGVSVQFFVLPGNFFKITFAGVTTPNVLRQFICQNGTFTDSGDLSGSRSFGTVFQNNTLNTKFIAVQGATVSAAGTLTVVSDRTPAPVNIVDIGNNVSNAAGAVTSIFIVPPGDYYKVTASSGTLSKWHEYSWNIPCTKSTDMLLTTGAGQTRTAIASSNAVSTGVGTATVVSMPTYMNTDPFRVRWVQFMGSYSGNIGVIQFLSGETCLTVPGFQIMNYVNTSATSAICTVRGPVAANTPYIVFFNSGGTPIQNHWWEYTLG